MQQLVEAQVSMEDRNKCSLFPYIREDVLSIQEVEQRAGWDITAFNLSDLWASTRGQGVKIAVIDTGCQIDHEDLIGNILPGVNFIDPSKPPIDDCGHGCIHPDTFIHTNFCGIERIKVLYERIVAPELLNILPDGNISWIKDVRDFGIKTYAFDPKSGQTVIRPIEYLHRSFINETITSVQLEGNIKLELTPWHPVYLKQLTKGRRSKIIKKKAEDLVIGDKFIRPDGDNAGRLVSEYYRGFGKKYKQCKECGHIPSYFIKINSKCKKCGNNDWQCANTNYFINEDLAYLVGIVLTDGHINIRSRRVEVCSETSEILT